MIKFLLHIALLSLCIATATAQTITTYATGLSYPFSQVFNPTGDTMYATGQGSGYLYRIVGGVATSIGSVDGYGIARNNANTYLYTGDRNTMDRISIATSAKTNIVPSGFDTPWGVAIDHTDSYLYVADGRNNQIKKINLSDNSVSVLVDSLGTFPLNMPYALALNSAGTMLYVANAAASNILAVTIPGGVVSELVSSSTASIFGFPTGLAFDATESYLYAASYYGDIFKISMSDHNVSYLVSHTVTTTLGTCSNLTMDSQGNLYVASTFSGTIFKITTTPTGVMSQPQELARTYSLEQNYPNPFNPTTTIRYTIPNVGTQLAVPVLLKVYNILGEEVATLVDEIQEPGNKTVQFNATNLPSGMYSYRMQAGNYSTVKKMFLVK